MHWILLGVFRSIAIDLPYVQSMCFLGKTLHIIKCHSAVFAVLVYSPGTFIKINALITNS